MTTDPKELKTELEIAWRKLLFIKTELEEQGYSIEFYMHKSLPELEIKTHEDEMDIIRATKTEVIEL